MHTDQTVSLQKVLDNFSMEKLYLPDAPENIQIRSAEINRPGIQLAGFYGYFDNTRVQIIGKTEEGYIELLEPQVQRERYREFFSKQPVLVIVARKLTVPEFVLQAAEEYKVPVLRSEDSTSDLAAALISFLSLHLAPRITRHGVLVEVYGEGILLLGESGVGKSETAIELIKRGHRLIADDAVEIRRVSSKSLVGTAPDNIRHFIELRGIGIVNASRIFGVGAVKLTEKIDMVIKLEPWDADRVYDRVGLEEQTDEILGIRVPSVTIPVKPGRNLAVIIEVASMNNRQKKLGYNAAQDLLGRLGMLSEEESKEESVEAFS